MRRLALATILVTLLGGCAATASNPAESKDRAECKDYARALEHSGRMKDACLISRGHTVTYNTNGGGVEVRSKAEPRPARGGRRPRSEGLQRRVRAGLRRPPAVPAAAWTRGATRSRSRD